jgi:parallel beta-helix repeat protein
MQLKKGLFICLVLCSSILNNVQISSISGISKDIKTPSNSDEIIIWRDDLWSFCDSGDGSLVNPYIIENRVFQTDVKLYRINSAIPVYVVLRNCTFYNFRLRLDMCRYINITNSFFTHDPYDWCGLGVVDSNNINIHENQFNNCSLDLDESNNNQVNSNNFTVGGIRLYKSWNNDIETSNLVNGKRVLYFESESHTIIDGGDDIGQIILVNCTYFSISNLNLQNTNVGIQLHYSTNVTLNKITILNASQAIILNFADFNTISNCHLIDYDVAGIWTWFADNNLVINSTAKCKSIDGMGIAILASSENIVENNTCSNNINGIWIGYKPSFGNTLRHNTVFDNRAGISILYADITNISNCISVGNKYGIYLEISINSTVKACDVFNNSDYGFYLDRNDDCEFVFNTISQNRIGFYIDEESDYNLVWQNNFLNNSEYQAMDDGIGNQWNASIGNYWSDFDFQSDFYQIPGNANSTDYAPIAEAITISTSDDENLDKKGIVGYSWGLIAGSTSLVSCILIYSKKRNDSGLIEYLDSVKKRWKSYDNDTNGNQERNLRI